MPQPPNGPFDYGDDATAGLHVKRCGKTVESYDLARDFGVFLGRDRHGNFIVGIKFPLDFTGVLGFSAVESYASVMHMHESWRLD